jgi:hypothetical protein
MTKHLPKQYISNFNIKKISKNNTILNNEKNVVVKKFTLGLSERNITNTLNSAIELHCSGYFDLVLSKLINLYFNEINIAQLHGIHYIHSFINYYNKYDYKRKKTNPIEIVNDQVIRNFICFFAIIIITSIQRKIIKLPKIKSIDFNMAIKKKTLISKDLQYVSKFLNNNDPKEIIIPLSEICNYFNNKCINDREHKIIFWLAWLFEYEKIYHNKNLLVAERSVKGIDKKYHRDFIWIIWTIIKYHCNDNNKKYIYKLFDLYTNNFTKSSRKSKSNLIITAILIIINPLPKINYPIETLKLEQYKNASLHELRCNDYYLKLFQNIIYQSV